MDRILSILAVAGHLATLQAIGGLVVWWLSPWPQMALAATLGWLVVMVWDLRHPHLAGNLSRWPLGVALLLAESPALVFGAWNLLTFLGLAPRFELGAFIVQWWLTPMAPLLACCPTWTWLDRDGWLWVLSVTPILLVISGMLVGSSRSRKN